MASERDWAIAMARCEASLSPAGHGVLIVDRRGCLCEFDEAAQETFQGDLQRSQALSDCLPAKPAQALMEAIDVALGGEVGRRVLLLRTGRFAVAALGYGSEVCLALRALTPLEGQAFPASPAEAYTFLNAIIDNIPDMIFVKEAGELRFVHVNRAAEELLGYQRHELLGKNDHDFFKRKEAEFFTGKDREVLARGEPHDIPEEPIHTRKLGRRLLHTKKVPILDPVTAEPRYLLGISEDITDRKEAELAKSMLREVHHRVKNNLQVIEALLSLRAERAPPEAVQLLQEVGRRVRVMALIHERLQEGSSASKVEFTSYLRDLVPHLLRAYSVSLSKIQARVLGAELLLSVDTSLPCGLIVHELVANAIEHAFPEERSGSIEVRVDRALDGAVEISIDDDGVGLSGAERLGLELVRGLTHQIGGEISFKVDRGTQVSLRFREVAGPEGLS